MLRGKTHSITWNRVATMTHTNPLFPGPLNYDLIYRLTLIDSFCLVIKGVGEPSASETTGLLTPPNHVVDFEPMLSEIMNLVFHDSATKHLASNVDFNHESSNGLRCRKKLGIKSTRPEPYTKMPMRYNLPMWHKTPGRRIKITRQTMPSVLEIAGRMPTAFVTYRCQGTLAFLQTCVDAGETMENLENRTVEEWSQFSEIVSDGASVYTLAPSSRRFPLH
jgi:hypothetical protein